jgi:crotonobetainyl-CoA:carnitine CoA-transferase CaiB-like acyl-CoA transferase
MGQFIAGPFHGKILAEFGAEVIKIGGERAAGWGGGRTSDASKVSLNAR